ncbi:MAG: hypothetical protein PHD54_06050 [Desulfuromonadaceae bacterium]|nr:hypothetical protein [Desulfuromonadaceae bacterium]
MFESQYNEEMEAEVKRLEAQTRATNAGHPEWLNACALCGSELMEVENSLCNQCGDRRRK